MKKGVLKNSQENTCDGMSFLIKLRPDVFMKKETPVQVCEIFKNSSGRLLLSMKGTKNCLYRRKSRKYDSTVKKKGLC